MTWQTTLYFSSILLTCGLTGFLAFYAWRQRVRFYRAQAETAESLRKSEESYHGLIEHASDGIFIADASMKYIEVNPSGCAMLGYTREEILAKRIPDLVAPEDLAATPLRLDELRQGKIILSERRLIRKDGSLLPVEISARLLPDGRFQSILRDITARKQVEDALRESERRLSEAQKMAQLGHWIWDVKTGSVEWSEEVFNIFHLDPKEFTPRINSILALSPWPEDHERDKELIRRALETHEKGTYEQRFLRPDKSIGYYHSTFQGKYDNGGNLIFMVGTVLDITARKQAEEALVSSEKKYRELHESLRDAYVRTDMAGDILEFNTAYLEMLGYSAAEIHRLKYIEITPEKWHTMEGKILATQILPRGYSEVYEKEYKRKDGVIIPVELRTFLLRDEDGNPSSMWAIVRDISDRKRVEANLADTRADLERSNKDLEQFAYVASHDLQEPLRMVSSYTQLLAQRYEGQLDAKAQKYINYAVDGAVRMQQLINDLLAYSRVNTRGQPAKPIDSHAVLGEVLINLSAAIQECRVIVTNDDLPTVRADATQLSQLFQNLIANAIKFRRADPPHVHISACDLGSEWRFAVQDNGIGIEAQYAEKIFVIFQRLHTRQEHPGTGIGLAVCKRIMERHGGKIWFESEPGQGSTFYFTLPK